MTTEEKLLLMFHSMHGKLSKSCSAEIHMDDNGNPNGVSLIKNGQILWWETKLDLLFEYTTERL